MRRFSSDRLNTLLESPIISVSGVMKAAKLSYSAFWNIRKGKSVPSSNTLAAIADALSKPLDYFFEEDYLQIDMNGKRSHLARLPER